MKHNNNYRVLMFMVCFVAMSGVTASAGLLDKLNQATKKLNDFNNKQSGQGGQSSSQSQSSGEEDPDRPLDLNKQKGFKGSCEGKRSATCMDYMEAVDHCMEPLKGYRMKVTADRIEYKLKNEKLTDAQKKILKAI